MIQTDIVIVGAGLSGLSLASYCTRAGLKTTVLEKETRLGGAFHSHRMSDQPDGFWLELGAHTCYNSYRNFLDLVDHYHVNEQMLPREKLPFKMLVNNQIKSIFTQLNYPELLLSLPGLLYQKKADRSVDSYYSSILGRKNYHRVFRHFFNAVPSQSTEEFPADVLFKSRSRRKDVLKSYTFAGGLQSIVDAIGKTDAIEFLTGQEPESIERADGLYRVRLKDGTCYATGTLAVATPAPVAAKLLQAVHPELSGYLAQIQTARINSVAVILEKKLVPFQPVAGIISPNDLFYSIVSRDTVTDEKYRGLTFHFKPEISKQEDQLRRISEILGVTTAQIAHIVTKQNQLPALRVGHYHLVDKIDRNLAGKQLMLTGNYFSGVAIEDCVSRSLSEYTRVHATPG
ncbi:MAG: FAD-dependent oxidoreductase [Gammaproteobacteria bacterium]|nr:FAD-dependent oxidoreductase [Gammaproteobacteria bacterium]